MERNGNHSEGDNVSFNGNQINYESWTYKQGTGGAMNGCNLWRYMYGYIEYPSELATKGGTLTITADTAAYYNWGESKCYLSLVSGNQLYTQTNLSATDMQMNTNTGRTTSYAGTRNKDYDSTMPPLMNRSVTITVKPGEWWGRISYLHALQNASTGSVFGQRIENVRVSYSLADKTAPVINNKMATLNSDKRSATITANITDPRGSNEVVSGIKSVTIQKDGATSGVRVDVASNGDISHIVNENGYWWIIVYDNANNLTQQYVLVSGIDKVAPVVGGFTGQDTPTSTIEGGSLNVTFTITETGSGIASKECMFNGQRVTIMVSGDKYYFKAKANGRYTVSATDYAGNVGSASVEVTGVDNDPPTIGEISGNNDVCLFAGKNVLFRVTDKNSIGSVTVDNTLLTPYADGGYYYFLTNKNGTYRVTATDSLGNTGAYDITVTNCYNGIITAGAGVSITGLTSQNYIAANSTITVKIVSTEFGQKIVAPEVANATVVENYNYGLEAEYIVTFSGDYNYTQTINAKYEAVPITVQVNGQVQVFGFGTQQSFTAREPGATQRFVGWYNSAGVLISSDMTVKVTITSANAYVARYINVDETMITYLNLAGHVIDIKGVKLYDQTLEAYLASQTLVHAPENAYMEFAGWRVIYNQGGEVVAKATYTRTADKFNVTVDGVTTQYGYNERVNLTGDAATIGWAINGQMVSNHKDYSFFVINDVVITKVTGSSTVAEEARQIAVSTKDNIYVITGLLTTGKTYDEVGFLFADDTVKDEYLTMSNTLVTALPVYTITTTNQIVANVNLMTFIGKKVRLYTRIGNTFGYSDVITLG